MEQFLFKLAGSLYALALFLPAFIYEASLEGNPKYSSCVYAVQSDVQCSEFSFDNESSIECGTQDIQNPVDKNKIIEYCKGYDTPMTRKVLGYEVMLFGWLSIFLMNFAWYANLALLIAVLAIKKKNFVRAKKFAGIAILLALHSYFLKSVPANEGGTRYDVIANLGLGFYLWISSILCIVLSSWRMSYNEKNQRL